MSKVNSFPLVNVTYGNVIVEVVQWDAIMLPFCEKVFYFLMQYYIA